MTRTVIERSHQCTTIECGHAFVAQLEIVRSIRPSGTPRASVVLPFGVARGAPPAGLPAPANDPLPLEAQA